MGMASVLTDEPPEPRMDYKSYLKERNAKIALGEGQGKFLDQTILTLAGGALGLTLTFLHDHGPSEIAPSLSYLGIASLVLSLICVLVSLYSSQRSISQHIDTLDALCKNQFIEDESHKRLQNNPWNGATLWLNRLAGISLIAGIILLAVFVSCNLPAQTSKSEGGTQTMTAKDKGSYKTTSGQVTAQKGATIKPPPPPPQSKPQAKKS
jgi:amino acid transporter